MVPSDTPSADTPSTDDPSADDSYECRYGWTRGAAGTAAGAGLFGAAALGKLLLDAPDTLTAVCYAVAAIGSGLSAALLAGIATAHRVALRIGPDGILLGTPVRYLGRPVHVPWAEVAAVEIRDTAAPAVRIRRRAAPTVQRTLGAAFTVDGDRLREALQHHAPEVLPIVTGQASRRS
ncbi:hypothetical protein [Kitasatospora paranensis]|uniref:PH domain-containing protein n=1 Tax=Kitasatospora paranensis TaxID=258053 RepID=A0ABW2FUG6_9ACTN